MAGTFQGVPTSKRFDGRLFGLKGVYNSRSIAQGEAKRLRREGSNARVVSVLKGRTAVYARHGFHSFIASKK